MYRAILAIEPGDALGKDGKDSPFVFCVLFWNVMGKKMVVDLGI